jgi:hypothetical protein
VHLPKYCHVGCSCDLAPAAARETCLVPGLKWKAWLAASGRGRKVPLLKERMPGCRGCSRLESESCQYAPLGLWGRHIVSQGDYEGRNPYVIVCVQQ